MKSLENTTVDNIDTSTPEGKLLWTAICIICFIKFRDKKPDLVLEVIKDIRLNLFVDETLEQTMERIIDKYKSQNN